MHVISHSHTNELPSLDPRPFLLQLNTVEVRVFGESLLAMTKIISLSDSFTLTRNISKPKCYVLYGVVVDTYVNLTAPIMCVCVYDKVFVLQDVKFQMKLDMYDFCTPELQDKMLPIRRKYKEVEDKKIVSSPLHYLSMYSVSLRKRLK